MEEKQEKIKVSQKPRRHCKRVNTGFTQGDYDKIEIEASYHGVFIATFVRETVMEYVESCRARRKSVKTGSTNLQQDKK